MSDPFAYIDATERFALPLLYSGQAQKEIFVNEALSRVDALLHCSVAGTANSPPSTPVDGQSWLVDASATGDWTGKEGMLACRMAAQWLFVQAREGMWIFDNSVGQIMLHSGGEWKKTSLPPEPTGGSVVDSEARASIGLLIGALKTLGILPSA